MITQAEVSRAVRGATKAMRDCGLSVGLVTVKILNGTVEVSITTANDSPQLAADVGVEDLSARIAARAARRSQG